MSAFPRSRLLRAYPGRRSARWIGVTVGLALVAGLLQESSGAAAPTEETDTNTVADVPLQRPDDVSAATTDGSPASRW